MKLRIVLALIVCLAGLSPAHAQRGWPDPGNTGLISGFVQTCLNGSAQAVPCSAAFPLQTARVGAYPAGAVPITAASGNVAAATATATLAATAGKTTYICGFAITSAGSTAAAVVSPTVTGTITGTLTFTYASVAGVTLSNQPLVIPFTDCVPANAANVAIAVALPSLGAGNTNATVNAWGFQL